MTIAGAGEVSARSERVRYLVAYRPDDGGHDALRLAVALARAFGASLDLLYVVHEHGTFAPAYPPVGRDEPIIAQRARTWLAEGAAGVPDDVSVTTHVRYAAGTAEGIIAAAVEFGARLVVAGSDGKRGLGRVRRRHRLGSVTTALLHSAPCAVALAPRGYEPRRPIESLDCAVGLRPGGQQVLDTAMRMAVRTGLPLRVITLVDADGEVDDAGVDEVRAHVARLLALAIDRYGAPTSSRIVFARGGDIPAVVEATAWVESSVLIVGSARMAAPRRLFLGVTVGKMLHRLPVPVMVVPQGDDPATATTAATDAAAAAAGAASPDSAHSGGQDDAPGADGEVSS